jgi:hypothetical protein
MLPFDCDSKAERYALHFGQDAHVDPLEPRAISLKQS